MATSRTPEPIPPSVARKLAVRIGRGNEAVAVGSRSGVIEWTNAAWTRVTGWPLEHAVTKPVMRLLDEAGIPRDILDFVSSKFLVGRRCSVELPLRSPDGQERWIHLEVDPVPDETGDVSDFVVVATDITERRLAEDALDRHLRRNGVDPAASATSCATSAEDSEELALLGVEGLAAAREAVALCDEMLRGEAKPDAALGRVRERAAALLDRAERGRPAVGRVHVPELVTDCCRTIAPLLEREVSLDVELSSSTPPALAPRSLLQEIVTDLMRDAARVMAGSWGTLSVTAGVTEPGQVLVSEVYHASFFGTLGDREPRVFIELHDTGVNLAPAQLARLAGAPVPPPAGRLLTLMRSRMRLAEHGGELHVSAAPGCGTRVLLLLPAAG